MAFSPFEHPFLSGLLGDEEIAIQLSADADIEAMLSFEASLARVEARLGLIPADAAEQIAAACGTFEPDMVRLKAAVGTDSVVIPELVKQLRHAVGGDAANHVHFGATSQDVIDTSLMLRMKTINVIFTERIKQILALLNGLDQRFGSNPLMGFTRMQAAIPISVSDRLESWRSPLARQLTALNGLEFPVQLGGAAGSLDKLGSHGAAVRAALAEELGLAGMRQWQSQRDGIADNGHHLSLVTGALGKIGQDLALMAQSGREISMRGGGKSSAMAHKLNPVGAETLVMLARFNAVQLSGLHQAMVHEQERSGAAWTLEWLILPQMVMATAASLRLAAETLAQIERMGAPKPGASS
ncbi:3-carboxy-cis,cis-muconate cycloisomerase [Rhizobium wenxiniae]|uniref:3-carboxy-cis,cis-muconate cycloisomerase n=1 Tax=Rhizobium wenxiniae TaxID=1737357 RepID=UPI001C6E98B7|nr:3-carboxy-cis,cis-muconate cycloisomerase [Rhizobium wenxiniae]MBW9089440.1 3-carboxy-cis,cis-muconate cycloisomerase [Rhizobium wenxiniae]